MKGVKYFFDEHGEPSAVLIDLKKNPEIWEDFRDLMIIEERTNEPVEDFADVKRRALRKASPTASDRSRGP